MAEVTGGSSGDTTMDAKGEITSLEGIPALSLDAISSVAYGPEAMLAVLATAGAGALAKIEPITVAIVVLLAILVFSYRQVIQAYPDGGGCYAVSKANLGWRASRLAAAALVVDYVLTVAVSISAGVAALVSAFPRLAPDALVISLAILALLAALNLRGLATSARALILPTAVFIVGIYVVIGAGFLRYGFARVSRYYTRLGAEIGLGMTPGKPVAQQLLVVVPVNTVSRLTQDALGLARSLSEAVVAVSVQFDDESEAALKDAWDPGVELVVLRSRARSVTAPLLGYLRSGIHDASRRVLVLIPEVEPRKLRHQLLQNQRGLILASVLRRQGDVSVALMPFRLHGD
jgi:hypothetical protein